MKCKCAGWPSAPSAIGCQGRTRRKHPNSVVLVPFSCQFLRNVIVQNIFDGERDDDAVFFREKPAYFLHGIARIVKGNEEPLFALRPAHGCFKGIYVRPARPVRSEERRVRKKCTSP